MNDDIIAKIELIQETCDTSEFDVMNSLLNNYIKMISVIEQHPDAMITESFKDDLNEPVTGNKNESIIKRILMFIPRLIHKIIETVHRLFLKAKIKMVGGTLDEIMAVDPKIRAQVQEAYQQAWDEINDISSGRKHFSDDEISEYLDESAKMTYVRKINDDPDHYYKNLSDGKKQMCQIDIAKGKITSSFKFDGFVDYITELSAAFDQADANTWDISDIKNVNTFKKTLENANRKAGKYLRDKDQTIGKSWIAGQHVYQCSILNQYLRMINDAKFSIDTSGKKLCDKVNKKINSLGDKYEDEGYVTALNALLYEIQNWQKYYIPLCSKFVSAIQSLKSECEKAVEILESRGVKIIKRGW